MNTIKATVRNGRVETETPLDLPDGTEVLVQTLPQSVDAEAGWDNSPEGIAAWLKWYDSLEPLIFTDEERQAWEDDRKARREWEFAHADERLDRLRRSWE